MDNYPLNKDKDIFNKDLNNYNNWREINYSNIEIIYDKENDIPSIYRCPVCLSIPILYY